MYTPFPSIVKMRNRPYEIEWDIMVRIAAREPETRGGKEKLNTVDVNVDVRESMRESRVLV